MNFNEVFSLKWICERMTRCANAVVYNRATVERWQNFMQYQLIACIWADRKQRRSMIIMRAGCVRPGWWVDN